MIFTQLDHLKASPVDLAKGFNIQVNPQTCARISEINDRRH